MANAKLNQLPAQVILWGGTGQAKVVRPIIEGCGAKVVAVFDDSPGLKPPFSDVEVFLGWEAFERWIKGRNRANIGFCPAIGNPHGRARLRFHERLSAEGLQPVTFAHPAAVVHETAMIDEGAQILAGAIIMAETRIGRQSIININAVVDHECFVDAGCEVSPSATLCGEVKLGINAWVGVAATVMPRVRLGNDAIVGAGALATKDVPDGVTVVGVPAVPLVRKAAASNS